MARKKRVDNKGRVLRTGEGQRAEDGRYYYRYTDLLKNTKTVYANTLMDLREKEEEIQKDLSDGINTADGEMTLNQLFQLYMSTKTGLRESTKCNYKNVWKNAIENTVLGNMKIKQIKQLHIRTFYAELTEQGLAESTIRLYHLLISSALDMAVSSDMIRKNPAKDCQKSIRGTKKERQAMTRDQQAALMEFVNADNRFIEYEPMLTFAFSTGLRVGELTGLRWENVDLKNGIVQIRKQLVYKNYGEGCKFYFQELKTDAGRRDIPLTDSARKSLIRQKELCMKLGWNARRQEVEGVSDFVFINTQGRPFATNAINLILKNIVDAYNTEHPDGIQLPHISAHILRHTACTRFAEAGLDPKTLQAIMGHADISVTMNIYTHLDFSQIQEKVNEVQESVMIG